MNITELLAFIRQVGTNDKGVTAMEYGVIAGFVVIAIAATVATMGAKLQNSFSKVGSSFPS